ncbi:conjugal transfer protein TrbB, partial [Citrobacter freundii]
MIGKVAASLLMVFPLITSASVRDELAAMDEAKINSPEVVALTKQSPGTKLSLMTLPDGRQVNMKDYAVVLFMQAHCQYSAKFDPQIKEW